MIDLIKAVDSVEKTIVIVAISACITFIVYCFLKSLNGE
jgi:hypothetical protein